MNALDASERQRIAELPNEVFYVRGRLDPPWYWPLSPREKAKIERDRREFAAILRRLPNGRVGQHGGINEANSAGRT